MDSKLRLWRKKHTENPVTLDGSINNGEQRGKQEIAELRRFIQDLSEKLSDAVDESNAKDDAIKKHATAAQEAIAGWGKAEAEAVSLKQALDNSMQKASAADDTIVHLDGALKECMRQLRHVREEQEQRMHDALIMASREHEIEKTKFEGKLTEAAQELNRLRTDNNRLNKANEVKERLIEEMKERKCQAEAYFNSLLERLDASGKSNASLKYEACVLEKELEIRNEEKEYNRQSVEALQRQQFENAKKITKLETECQRLVSLVRKRLPGPAAVAQMRTEVETLGRGSDELGRRQYNPAHGSGSAGYSPRAYMAENNQELINKNFMLLTERLSDREEETRVLREALSKKNSELEYSRNMCARAVSRLSQIEGQLGDFPRGRDSLEPAKSISASLASLSVDGCNEDEMSCSESWASALVSELEQFRLGKPKQSCKSFGASELSLMDDFAEMERLAASSDEKLSDQSPTPRIDEKASPRTPSKSTVSVSQFFTDKLVGMCGNYSTVGGGERDINFQQISVERHQFWLFNILKSVLHSHITDNVMIEVLDAVKNALEVPSLHSLADIKSNYTGRVTNWEKATASRTLTIPHVIHSHEDKGGNLSPKCETKPWLSAELEKSIFEMIDVIERATQASQSHDENQRMLLENGNESSPYKNLGLSTGYTVRTIQWRSSELTASVSDFIKVCHELLQGRVGLEDFVSSLISTLNWILDHCFSLQDVSSMKDAIKKRLDWTVSYSESESEAGGLDTPRLQDGGHVSTKFEGTLQSPASKLSAAPQVSNELGVEQKLHVGIDKKEKELFDSQKSNPDQKMKSKGLGMEHVDSETHRSAGAQSKSDNLPNGNLQTLRPELNARTEGPQEKLPFLELELKGEDAGREALERTATGQQLQLKSVQDNILKLQSKEDEKRPSMDSEITAAKEKLAECQETILNLGKQLKALAAPESSALFDKVVPLERRGSSLLDQMLAEDEAYPKSPKTKEIICSNTREKFVVHEHQKTDDPKGSNSRIGLFYGRRTADVPKLDSKTNSGHVDSEASTESPAKSSADAVTIIVPKKQYTGGFLKKLLCRKTKTRNKRGF